ncbi:MAG TPA: FecR family protein [Chthoniobacteraceae bacterium]|jgi:hypothetical protein
MTRHLLLTVATAAGMLTTAMSAPLQEAQITRIVNDVRVVDPASGTKPAMLEQTIRGDLGVRTGAQSRAELLFSDQTLTRLGADTFFSFTPGTRDLTLDRGTLLLQVPKGRGGARIRTAAVTASITGTTILLEHTAKKAVKVVVLEGSLRLFINNAVGESTLLNAGKMIILSPNARQIPEPVDVDLQKLVSTSGLVKMTGGKKSAAATSSLPSTAVIQKEIERQAEGKARGQLAQTNLEIKGKGTKVSLSNDLTLAMPDQQTQANKENPGRRAEREEQAKRDREEREKKEDRGNGGRGSDGENGNPNKPEKPVKPRPNPRPPGKPEEPTIVIDRTIIAENPPTGHGNPNDDDGDDDDRGRARASAKNRIGKSHLDTKAGDLKFASGRKTGVAIHVKNTGELLSLLNGATQGGVIQLTSAGGAIVFDGGKAVAEKGTVELLNHGVKGVISLNNATISGDVVKIGALAANGEVLIRGGTISADTTLKLYAPQGNGSVRFLEDTTLGGNGAKLIVGQQVTIDNGKTVTIGGSQAASVYTQKPNYTGSGGNGSTTGTFGGQGANTFSKKDAPGF